MNRLVVATGALLVVAAVAAGCGGDTTSPITNAYDSGAQTTNDSGTTTDDASTTDGSTGTDASIIPVADSGTDGIGPCVSAFGSAMDNNYGRLDGTLHAIVRPQDQSCAMPNGTHVDLEVDFGGATYRLLIDVQSDTGTDKRVYYLTKNAPLPGDPWSEGWHTSNVSVDYPTTFGVHFGDFTQYTLPDLTDIIVNELTIGEKLSIYSMGFVTGGHDIHRNAAKNEDGAVVIGPDTASPQVLLFHFQDDPTF